MPLAAQPAAADASSAKISAEDLLARRIADVREIEWSVVVSIASDARSVYEYAYLD